MPQFLLNPWSAVVITDGVLSAYLMGGMAPAERALLAAVAVAVLFAVPWRLGQASPDIVQFIATTAFALGFRGWPEVLRGMFLGMVLTLAWALVLRVRGRLGEQPLWQPVEGGHAVPGGEVPVGVELVGGFAAPFTSVLPLWLSGSRPADLAFTGRRTAITSSRSSSAAAYCFSSLAHIRVMAAMSSSSRGSTKYFFTDPSKVRLIVSANCRPLPVKLISDTRPSPWSALRWRCPASMRSWTSRDALVGLTLTSLPARARTD